MTPTPSHSVSRGAAAAVAFLALAWWTPGAVHADSHPAAGKFLVASRQLGDPNFRETVVLLLDYGPHGATGLVINRPTKVSVPEVLPGLEEVRHVEDLVYLGGPVATESMMMLLRSPVELDESTLVFEDIHVSQSIDLLRRYAQAETDRPEYRLYAGYAGWGPGQLDGEIERGDWYVVDGDSALVLTEDPASTWGRLIPAPRSLQAWSRLGPPSSIGLR